MTKYWKNQALKRSNIRGEHAYLEGVEDYKKALLQAFNLDKQTPQDKVGIYIWNKIRNLKPLK